MVKGVQRYIIIRNEKANANYTTQFIVQLFSEEGEGLFETRVNVLGHAQQGGCTSPFDRNMGTKLTARAVEWLVDKAKRHVQPDGSVKTTETETVSLLGLIDRNVMFTPVSQLKYVYRKQFYSRQIF